MKSEGGFGRRRVAFETLGCKLNQYETDSIATDFHKAGYEIVPYEGAADAYVVNTCTVTNKSDRKSRNLINRATNRREDDAVVVVTGCFVDSSRDYLEARDDVTYVVDNRRKSRIFHIVDAHFKGEILDPKQIEGDLFAFETAEKGFHTRSMVKIQDGCDNFCTFCIIPFVRGRATSRPLEAILENCRRLVELGSKEIVLTGVNMGRYRDGENDFTSVIAAVLDLPGDFRLRISSLEPEGLDERFVELLDHPKMCPHLHLCLQSGSDRILLQMRRVYRLEDYLDIVRRIRERHPDFNFTTDIIVGFPGETEEDFSESCRVSEEVGFAHIHTFKYSRRDGTRAERMPDQVSEREKSERSERIRTISEANKRRYRESMVGRTERVLVERIDEKGVATGYGEHYVPIAFEAALAPGCAENSFVEVEIHSIDEGADPLLRGRPV